MKKAIKLNWYNVNLNQFNKLREVMSIEDETERVISIAEILLGENITDLPLKEFNEQVKQLEFLKNEIPNSNPPKEFDINGRRYYMDCLLGNITTAQYIDFTNHSSAEKPDMAKMLSVFVIPLGHKYNDGYDMLQVIKDIEDLPIPVVKSTTFFFTRQFSKFIQTFQSYSIKRIKKQKLPKEQKQLLIQMVRNSVDLVSYPLS